MSQQHSSVKSQDGKQVDEAILEDKDIDHIQGGGNSEGMTPIVISEELKELINHNPEKARPIEPLKP